jgi:hypothetical protein
VPRKKLRRSPAGARCSAGRCWKLVATAAVLEVRVDESRDEPVELAVDRLGDRPFDGAVQFLEPADNLSERPAARDRPPQQLSVTPATSNCHWDDVGPATRQRSGGLGSA